MRLFALRVFVVCIELGLVLPYSDKLNCFRIASTSVVFPFSTSFHRDFIFAWSKVLSLFDSGSKLCRL